MSGDAVALVYWGGMLVLFFFWIYGIVSFGRDLRYRILPGIRQYRRGRRRLRGDGDEQDGEPDDERRRAL